MGVQQLLVVVCRWMLVRRMPLRTALDPLNPLCCPLRFALTLLPLPSQRDLPLLLRHPRNLRCPRRLYLQTLQSPRPLTPLRFLLLPPRLPLLPLSFSSWPFLLPLPLLRPLFLALPSLGFGLRHCCLHQHLHHQHHRRIQHCRSSIPSTDPRTLSNHRALSSESVHHQQHHRPESWNQHRGLHPARLCSRLLRHLGLLR